MENRICMNEEGLKLFEEAMKKVDEIDPDKKIPFGMRTIMAMGEMSKSFYKENNNE